MQKKRLLKLAKFLRTVPKENFEMTSWADFNDDSTELTPKTLRCGTTACALGWATVCFPKSKLKLRKMIDNSIHCYVSYNNERTSCVYGPYNVSLHAAKKFFGLTYQEARYLFVDPDTSNPKVVARRIEKLVAQCIKKKGK